MTRRRLALRPSAPRADHALPRRTPGLPLLVAALAAAVLVGGILALLAMRGGDPVAGPPAARPATTEGVIAQARAVLAERPDDAAALGRLAGASLDMARETGDPSWYAVADDAGRHAVRVDPRSFVAMDALGVLALARHRFPEALDWSRRSLRAAPGRFAPLGIAGDALVELGRYREGFATIVRRLELRPDLASYSRASYVRELQGDRAGAITLMSLAVDAGALGGEGRAWARVQLGLLRLGSGDAAGAEREMRTALAERPGDARATAGLARVLAAGGRLAQAETLYERATDRLPLPEYPAALAEIHRAQGRPAAAADDIALVRAMQRLLAANGVRTDLDLSLIEADVARPGAAAVARARAARATRPGVVGDDILGWVLTRAGRCDEGLAYARRSMRLGTRDALVLFHAGMAAACAGRRSEAAGRLGAALALSPRFSVRWAPVARRTLARVSAR